MEKIPKRIRNSYDAYLKYRQDAINKGYGLDRKLTLSEYAEVHTAYSNSHEPHIARKVAQQEKTFTRNEAAAIVRRLKNADIYESEYLDKELLKELQSTYSKSKDIYSLQLTPEQETILEERRRQSWIERGIAPKRTIQASARAELFNELIDAGVSYKETREIVYGQQK